jgi:hypothetical protein
MPPIARQIEARGPLRRLRPHQRGLVRPPGCAQIPVPFQEVPCGSRARGQRLRAWVQAQRGVACRLDGIRLPECCAGRPTTMR